VGGLLMILRGTEQVLTRTDAMSTNLCGMGGYNTTLVRTSLTALSERAPYAMLPRPEVPDYIERTGDLYSDFTCNAFLAGCRRVNSVIREIDAIRAPTGDWPSKRCSTHIGLQANMTGGSTMSATERSQMRSRAERYVMADVLGTDLRPHADALRRWATAH
jgi:hypothetical protein